MVLRVDEDSAAEILLELTVNGSPIASEALRPAAWRELTEPVRELLGQPASDAIAAVEESILATVTAREKRAAAESKRHSDAISAWTDTPTRKQPR